MDDYKTQIYISCRLIQLKPEQCKEQSYRSFDGVVVQQVLKALVHFHLNNFDEFALVSVASALANFHAVRHWRIEQGLLRPAEANTAPAIAPFILLSPAAKVAWYYIRSHLSVYVSVCPTITSESLNLQSAFL